MELLIFALITFKIIPLAVLEKKGHCWTKIRTKFDSVRIRIFLHEGTKFQKPLKSSKCTKTKILLKLKIHYR